MAAHTSIAGDARPRSATRRRSYSGGYRYARSAIFVFFAAAVDVFNVLDRGGSKRYLLLLVPIGTVFMIQMRHPSMFIRRMRGTDKVLLMIWGMGMIGSLYGVFFRGGSTTGRPLFFPMTLGFLYLFVLEAPTDEETGRLLKMITTVGAIYVGLAAVVNLGVLPHLAAFKQFRNAQLAYVMLGIAGAFVMKRPRLIFAMIVLEGFNFVAYPSATSILCIVAMLLTFFMTKPRGSRARPYALAIAALMIIMFGLANISSVASIAGDYFNVVGKVDANNGRLAIWTTGVQQWQESPFVGQVFTGGTVAQTFRTGNGQILQLPFHNDYVLFLAEGGMLGISLLITFIISLNVVLIRAFRVFVDQDRMERANLIRLLLVGFNAFFVAAAFNPVMEGMSRSAVLFSMYGLAMLVCSTHAPPVERTRSRGAAVASRTQLGSEIR